MKKFFPSSGSGEGYAEELEASHALLLKKQEQLKDIRNKTAPKEQLLSLLDISEKTATDLEETLKSIEKEKCALPASAEKSALLRPLPPGGQGQGTRTQI